MGGGGVGEQKFKIKNHSSYREVISSTVSVNCILRDN